MTTAITFSRQNDAGLRACTTYYWENLVLVVVLVLESKALYFNVKFYNNQGMLRTCQDILPFGAMFLAFLPVCSIVSLVLRCWVGVLHSYSPFSVSTVLTISSVPNSVILNLRLLPKKTTKVNDVHEGRCGNNRLRKGNFRRQSSPPFHTFLSKFSSFWVAVSSSVWEFWKSRCVPFDYEVRVVLCC